MTRKSRTPWQITRSVWHALFMREAVSRTTEDRMGWFWMIAEPALIVVIMVAIHAVIRHNGGRTIAGADYVSWLIVGLLGFYLFRENMFRPLGAIEANRALFAYRQIKPIDPILVRCYLEGILKTLILFIFILIGGLLGIHLIADHPLASAWFWLSLWGLGLGAGLTLSAASGLVPEIGKISRMLSLPLLIGSGVLFPLNFLPPDVLYYLMFNPIAHGLELLRESFFTNYRVVDGTDRLYLLAWSLCLITIGLILHVRFEIRLKRK